MQDRFNIIPVTLAVLLHVIVVGSLFVVFDLTGRTTPQTPLAVTATLVTESAVIVEPEPQPRPEPVVEPEPEPEPEPVVEEPDPNEQERIRLEEQARRQEAERERQRLQQIEDAKREAERRRQAELAAEEEARRKAEQEAELERIRREAERQRQEDIERQREQNRLEQQRLEEELRQSQIEAEAERLAARSSEEMAAYVYAIGQKVRRNWARPGTAPDNLECVVAVQQLPNGEVVSVQVRRCNADDVVVRSIEAAVRRASPLPLPSNPLLFDRNLEFRFRIED